MQLPARDERGETLIEVLVGLVILSIAAVAVLTAVQLSTKVSDTHRKQTTGGAYVKSFAEAMQRVVSSGGVAYVKCAGANEYRSAALGQISLPPGYSADDFQQSPAVPLSGNGGAGGSCPDGDTGVQRVTLTVGSSDGRASESLVVILRKPCSPGGSCPS